MITFVEHGSGLPDSGSRLTLDQSIATGRGGVFLKLSDEQYYAKLKR